jgi:hypothetical protein
VPDNISWAHVFIATIIYTGFLHAPKRNKKKQIRREVNQMGGVAIGGDDSDVEEKSTKPTLNPLNYLNLVFFIANVLVVNLVGTAGLGGLPSNAEQSAKYQVRWWIVQVCIFSLMLSCCVFSKQIASSLIHVPTRH